jgi:hypothetical protein
MHFGKARVTKNLCQFKAKCSEAMQKISLKIQKHTYSRYLSALNQKNFPNWELEPKKRVIHTGFSKNPQLFWFVHPPLLEKTKQTLGLHVQPRGSITDIPFMEASDGASSCYRI